MSTCTARRKDGTPCTVRARAGRPFCPFHDPELAEQRATGKRAGGEHKRTAHRLDRLTPASLKPVLERLHDAMAAVEEGSMEPRVGTALATLAGAIVKVHEVSELEARLERLEAGHEQHRTG